MPDESPYDQPNEQPGKKSGETPDGTPADKKALGENLKQRLDELEVEKHLHQLVDEAEKVAGEAVERVGSLAYERRDEVAGWLAKATVQVNERTKGQYSDKVEKVRTGLLGGLDKLAERRRIGDPVAEIEPAGPEESGAGTESEEPGRPTDPPLS